MVTICFPLELMKACELIYNLDLSPISSVGVVVRGFLVSQKIEQTLTLFAISHSARNNHYFRHGSCNVWNCGRAHSAVQLCGDNFKKKVKFMKSVAKLKSY